MEVEHLSENKRRTQKGTENKLKEIKLSKEAIGIENLQSYFQFSFFYVCLKHDYFDGFSSLRFFSLFLVLFLQFVCPLRFRMP